MGDLWHVDARLRDLEQRARSNSQKPATMQDLGDLARYVREMIEVIENPRSGQKANEGSE